MTIQVSKTQRSRMTFSTESTVLDLVQALTENLGGEWDEAKLEKPVGAYTDEYGNWSIGIVLEDGGEEPNRPERWTTDDGKHVAVWNATQERRECNCGYYGDSLEVERHMNEKAGFSG